MLTWQSRSICHSIIACGRIKWCQPLTFHSARRESLESTEPPQGNAVATAILTATRWTQPDSEPEGSTPLRWDVVYLSRIATPRIHDES